MSRLALIAAVIVLALEVSPPRAQSGPGAGQDDALWQLRNLGKAFYENPTTQYEAVEQFRKALALAPNSARERLNYALALLRAGKTDDGLAELEKVQQQDPAIPHTWFNLGIQYKKRGTADATARAIAQFEKLITLVRDEPIAHYNLGALYKTTGRAADALAQFEIAVRLKPSLAGPHFQLYNAYRDPRVGRAEDAARELATFQALKKQQAGAVIPEDLEWSVYAEIWDPIEPGEGGPDPLPAAPSFRDRELLRGLDGPTAGLALLAADDDDRPDVVAWSTRGARLIAGGDTLVERSGLEGLTGILSIAPGDFDNDGALDLAIVAGGGISLWRNTRARAFAQANLPLPTAPALTGPFTRAAWIDYDHDYDLDLLSLGARSMLLRNAGEAGFTDVTKEFPFVDGEAVDAVAFEAVADTIGHDLIVSYANRAGVLYRDGLAGKYDAVPIEGLSAGSRSLLAQDINRDSWIDLVAIGSSSPIALINREGTLTPIAFPASAGAAATAGRSAVAVDFDNQGVADVLVGDRLLRWTVEGLREIPMPQANTAVRAAADFDGDGRVDLVSVDGGGAVRLATNASTAQGRWLRVTLTGVKNLKTAAGAEIEVRAGARYQKSLYGGVPVHFGLGRREQIDTVRITWPNGLIQNEPRQTAGRAIAYKEAPRLSGSCPMIFTWDGTRFRFLTDVLGVAPLGASAGDGTFFPVDHDEYVQVPGEALRAIDGSYEVRVTEELREVSYLDRIQLIALDAPSTSTVVTNDKFKGPPFPPFRLFEVERAIPPSAARDHRGADVRDRVLAADRRYPDAFARDFEGVAEPHTLDLDFAGAAPENRAILVLTGWVDWADGSTFRGASQEPGGGLVMPYLQVKNAKGEWQTVIDDMGLPAGKPKTIVVDLTGKFVGASREIRIVTNLCVYWDRVYLSERTDASNVRLTPLDPSLADLRFHGFSRPVIDPARKQPEAFVYEDVQPLSMWNPTPGLYTRYGDVRALLTDADDRLVIMGSGDEVRLRFDARALPPLPANWRREFLLLFDGWAKDADANTAFSQSVEPLPFHGMSAYPYAAHERFPRGDYAREYNTRPALRLLRPLPLLTSREPAPIMRHGQGRPSDASTGSSGGEGARP